jgi:signal peptidase II
MKVKRILKALIILMILSLNISCDQISKKIVRQKIDYNDHIGLVHNFLTITKVENTGAFLSLGHSLPKTAKIIFLILLPVILLGFGLFYLLRKSTLSNLIILGLCFIIGGGFGNLYDRVIVGSVTDFLHIDFVVFQTGIFNMADVSVMTGIFILLLGRYYNQKKLNYLHSDKLR